MLGTQDSEITSCVGHSFDLGIPESLNEAVALYKRTLREYPYIELFGLFNEAVAANQQWLASAIKSECIERGMLVANLNVRQSLGDDVAVLIQKVPFLITSHGKASHYDAEIFEISRLHLDQMVVS